MDELVFDAIAGDFHVHRQLPYETEDFGTSIIFPFLFCF